MDIAYFFDGEDKNCVMEILDGCCFFAFCGMRTLIDKSLLTISTNELKMHDLIQQNMGREIVCQQSLKDFSKHNGLLEKNMVRAKRKKKEKKSWNLLHVKQVKIANYE